MPPHWIASMITPDADLNCAPLLRREFHLVTGHGDVTRALLHATAHGVFTASVNGAPVGDDVLSPGWTSYEWRLRYRTYDVTGLLGPGPVVLGVAIGNGWYRGRLGWMGFSALYGTALGAFVQLEIEYSDGHRQIVVTDQSWRAGPSAVLTDDLYDGQTIDARRHSDDWTRPGFRDEEWVGVRTTEFDPSALTPYLGPPVVRHEERRPVRTWTSPSGRTLLDYGQNLVGWVRCTARGDAGGTITLRYGEVLEDGELSTRPLRSARATDRFILSGRTDTFEPTFTFHGFRYVEVDGWPGDVPLDELIAVVVHSDLRRIGHFQCSDDLLNQLHQNVVWGLRGNFLDVPTDCPQRDERMGWTGDLAVFAPSAAYVYDVKDFLRDWLADLAFEQRAADGIVPLVVPDVLKFMNEQELIGKPEATAVWSDVAVWVPWALWEAYGDRAVLDESYPSMAAHVRRVESLVSPNGLWDTGKQLGDWLDPTAPADHPELAKAAPDVIATACLYRSARMVADTATILGHGADAEHFAVLADRTKDAFVREYVNADGRIRSDAVTVYALAIAFGLLDGTLLDAAGRRLAELVAENRYRIATGFAGTPYVTEALTRTGHLDDAYRLLLEQGCPSWLYPVTMGATTVWERWDAMLPDGRINGGEMTSFNHYALGAVADWMHRTIGGIAPGEPGYRVVRVAPRPGGDLAWAEVKLHTPYGRVEVDWRRTGDGELAVEVLIPEGVTAEIDLPGIEPYRVGSGRHTTSLVLEA